MIIPIEGDPLSPERRSGESTKAYRAFSVYRDMGPDRSLDKACNLFYARQGKKRETARRTGQWAKWAQKYHWVERAETHDDLLDEDKREADAARRQERREKASRFEDDSLEKLRNLVNNLFPLLENALTPLVTEVTKKRFDKVTGTTTITKIKPRDLREVAVLTVAAMTAVRQAVEGFETKNHEEEPQTVDRIVWAKAPKLPIPDSPESGEKDPQPELDLKDAA